MHELLLIPDCRIAEVTRAGPASIHIKVQAALSGACCPACHTASQAVHSRYHRHPADLASFGEAVRLDVLVRRFYCRNAACPRLTFAEYSATVQLAGQRQWGGRFGVAAIAIAPPACPTVFTP